MELLTSAAVSSVIALIDWKGVLRNLARDAAGKGAKALLARLKPDERERVAKQSVTFFVHEFLAELEDKTPLSEAIPGYQDQLKILIERAAPDIAALIQPESKDVDLKPIEGLWTGLGLDPLPEGFDWRLVSANYARDVRTLIKRDPELRAQLATAQREQIIAAHIESNQTLARIAGPDPGFDLRGYRDFLRAKCGQLQLSVLEKSAYDGRIELWSVFVPQWARESAPVPELPREVLRQLREEGQVVSDLLIAAEDGDALAFLHERYQSSPVRPVFEILDENPLVVVLGDPGSGKTSLVKYRVHDWVKQDSAEEGRVPLPLWVELKEYAIARNVELLKYLLSGGPSYPLDANRVEQRLQSGRAVIYLDGLDEIFDAALRASVVSQIAGLAARYPTARIVVTSRIIGYEPERLNGAGFFHATLEDFDDSEVVSFLRQWHSVAEGDPIEGARLQAQIERALKESEALRALAGNPLLLTMMAILNRNQELPRDRVELYKEASRVLLNDWDARRALQVDVFGRHEKEALLRELAGAMQQAPGGLAGNLIPRTELLNIFRAFLSGLGIPDQFTRAQALVSQLMERNFILCPAGADRFSFVHRTFLEYFCAAWFYVQLTQSLDFEPLKELFRRHWMDEKWHEVLRLIAGMVSEKQAEALILLLLEQDGTHVKIANLMLAAKCLTEIRNRRALQSTDAILRRTFLEKAVRYEPPYYYEFNDASDEVAPTRRQAIALIASAWRSRDTLIWLKSMAEEDHDWIVRRAAIRVLARDWKEDPETSQWLKNLLRWDAPWPDVQSRAVWELALGWKDDPETLPLIKELARYEENYEIRAAAVQVLAQSWQDDPETLTILKDCARSSNSDVQKAALHGLARGWRDDSETLGLLKELGRWAGNSSVGAEAVRLLALGWRDDPETLYMLRERSTSHSDFDVRMMAITELARGWKDDPDTVPFVQTRTCLDKLFVVRMVGVRELARGWKTPLMLAWLKERVRLDEESIVRAFVVGEIARGWKHDRRTAPWLKERARSDTCPRVRSAAAHELARGWKDDAETLLILKEHIRLDVDVDVKAASAHELARGWKHDPEILTILKEIAHLDANSVVRLSVAQELSRGWKDDPETLSLLKECARSGTSSDVRKAAVQELVRGWRDDPEALTTLRECALLDEDFLVQAYARAGLDPE